MCVCVYMVVQVDDAEHMACNIQNMEVHTSGNSRNIL
jgi:hypothetical protein